MNTEDMIQTESVASGAGVPRWVRVSAVVAVLNAACVLVLGALITTFGVGMSDQVWPTVPWYLIVNGHVWVTEPARGFLIEHSHRLAAWALGLTVLVVPVATCFLDPHRGRRWLGVLAIGALLGGYGLLHVEMRGAWNQRLAGGGLVWPQLGLVAMGAAFALTLAAVWASVRSGAAGQWVRAMATLALVAVMVQGLLGGFRVFLHQLIGPQLAAIHGGFAQITFGLLVATWVLAAPRRLIVESVWRGLLPLAMLLLSVVLVQLVWGVWVRHGGVPVAQRLHLLTAFGVVIVAVLVAARILTDRQARQPLGFFAYHYLVIVTLQVILGVEAYLGKFAVVGPTALLPVAERPVTLGAAVIRTGHTLLGAALLASTVVLATRLILARGWMPTAGGVRTESLRDRVQDGFVRTRRERQLP